MKKLDLEKIAGKINELGLREPAIFLLESHLPLKGLAANLGLVLGPSLLWPLFGKGASSDLQRLLGEPGKLEELLEMLDGTR